MSKGWKWKYWRYWLDPPLYKVWNIDILKALPVDWVLFTGENKTRLKKLKVIKGNDDDNSLPEHSHHDKIPPWWEYVSYEHGWILSPAHSSHHWRWILTCLCRPAEILFLWWKPLADLWEVQEPKLGRCNGGWCCSQPGNWRWWWYDDDNDDNGDYYDHDYVDYGELAQIKFCHQ